MLTISPGMKASSVAYYTNTARAATAAAMDRQAAGGGLGEYYSEHETRAPVWLVAGEKTAAEMVGLGASDDGAEADLDTVTRWLDDGVAPSGEAGRAFTAASVRGFDLTFCAPKSVSLLRALDTEGVASKAVTEAHNRAISEAMEYLHTHAGYTRVHNAATGMKDLQRLPGFVAAAFQHETSRAGDPHLHTHVLLPNRQARADGRLVTYDSKSLHHEAKAAGLIYQATLRAELAGALGIEWGRIDPHTGMAEVAGVSRKTIEGWSQRSTQLREWAAENLRVVEGQGGRTAPTSAQLAAAQRATRPRKPEHLAWAELKELWAADERGFSIDEAAQQGARNARIEAARTVIDAADEAAAGIGKAAFTRADLIEAIAARMPARIDNLPAGVTPLTIVEVLANQMAIPLTEARQPHEREGHQRFTTAPIIAEERAIYELIGARDDAAKLPAEAITETTGLSKEQARAMRAIAASPWLVQTLSAPAGAGKTTSLKALREAAHRGGRGVLLVAPTGKAVDVARSEGAADAAGTVARTLNALRSGRMEFVDQMLLVVDEAGMVGTSELRELLAAATAAGAKTVLVGDAEQLAPVKARGGMFARLSVDLPWAQDLTEVWRMNDPAERDASLAIRSADGAQLAGAVNWYRDAGRLHAGDPVTMADDVHRAWSADRAEGVDSLLIADRWEVADALNERIHRQVVAADAPTITAARRHKIGLGDTIITRHNDATITVYDGQGKKPIEGAPVRNGQRWQVIKLDAAGDRIAARRIGDGALTVLEGEYLHQHVHHGYAVTVHAAQGSTAERCHAILSPTVTRAAAYVAMTRGRQTNQLYLYEQAEGERDHEHGQTVEGVITARRGAAREAAEALGLLLDRDNRPQTVVDAAQHTPREALPQNVVDLLDAHDQAVTAARTAYAHDLAAARAARQEAADRRAAQEEAARVQRATRALAAEIDWLTAAGARSPATSCIANSTRVNALPDDAREAVAAAATSMQTVQPIHIAAAADDKSAILAAIGDTVHRAHHRVLAVPGTKAAAEAAGTYANTIAETPATAIDNLASGRWELPVSTWIVVDDADHLDPDQLHALTRHAKAANAKVVLIADGAPDRQKTAGRHFMDTVGAHLPWARHVGRRPDYTTELDHATRSKHSPLSRSSAELLTRAAELARLHQQYVDSAVGYYNRGRNLGQERDRNRDSGYGLDL